MSRDHLKVVIGVMIFISFLIPVLIPPFNDSNDNLIYFEEPANIFLSGNHSDVDLSIIPEINYTALNASWYDQKIEMIIVTPPDKPSFKTTLEPLRAWKNEKGVRTVILDNFTNYGDPTDDNATKIRKMIQKFYNSDNIKWVLLAGDAQDNLIPIKSILNPIPNDANSLDPSDFYYADLDSDWNDVANLDWKAEVYVGRFPADNTVELASMVTKTLKYETNPYIGDWLNRMLLAGGISNYPESGDPDGEDEARLTQYIWQNYVQSEMNFKHLFRTTQYFDPVLSDEWDSLTPSNFKSEMNSGYSTVIFAGHGSAGVFADADGGLYDYSDALTVTNTNMPFLIYSDACSTATYGQNDLNIGEILINKYNAGAIGYIGALKDTYYLVEDPNLLKLNRGNAKLFWKEFFENKIYQQGKTLYDSKIAYVNSDYYQNVVLQKDYPINYSHYRNLLTYNLLGDPEVDIYTNIPMNVENPFNETIYEGQLVSILIRDKGGKVIPYARIHLKTDDGKYRTVYADVNGKAEFRLLPIANENYNVTITGHNLIPSYFNFTTLPDNDDPFPEVDCSPSIPSTLSNVYFNIKTNESKSGIESIYVFLSNNSFDNYTIHLLSNGYKQNESAFKLELNKLDPGLHEYSLIIVARDYVNNTKSFVSTFSILIKTPITDYILIIASILIVGLTGISVIVVYTGIQKYSSIYKRMEVF